MPFLCPIAVGVAGWSYPDWKGFVYPPGTRDELRFIGGYVDMVEINSTFYCPPAARMVAGWADRTADLPGFYFTAKLHQDVTHRGEIAPEMVRAFHEGFAPLAGTGRLRHLLAQFKWDFDDTPPARTHLQRIGAAFGSLTHLTLELRHRSWQAPEALAFLESLGVSVANLDYPLARNSFDLERCGVGRHAYLRLHGRNAAAWFDKGAGRDQTYNYLYNRREVESIRDRAMALAKISTTLTIVANNHYQGKEVVNALQLRSLFLDRKVPAPAGLVEKYPELREYVE
jgi:uncharacterized protein YecE (DUF72 family)